MKTQILREEELYQLVEQIYNPPIIQNQQEENLFQAEIKREYARLVEHLSVFGEEGDYYGISDFSVRPTLKDFPRVNPPPAAHDRKLCVFVLTEKFYRSNYLQIIHQFLSTASADYQIEISTDFDPNLYVKLFVTSTAAQIYCENSKETARLQKLLSEF